MVELLSVVSSSAPASSDWTDIATAIATVALAILTGPAVLVGARAATFAANTYRLESEPIIIIRMIDISNEGLLAGRIFPLTYMVVGRPLLGDGIDIRLMTPNDVHAPVGASGMPRSSILLEVQNIGRSPALDLAIPFRVSAPLSSGPRMQRQVEGGRADGEDTEQIAVNDVKVLGIGAQSPVYLRVYNDFGGFASVSPQDEATVMTPRGGARKPRQSVRVLSDGPFIIPDPTHYQAIKRAEKPLNS